MSENLHEIAIQKYQKQHQKNVCFSIYPSMWRRTISKTDNGFDEFWKLKRNHNSKVLKKTHEICMLSMIPSMSRRKIKKKTTMIFTVIESMHFKHVQKP